eukprot:jgi/Chrzof1/7814/Cz02g37160.t1
MALCRVCPTPVFRIRCTRPAHTLKAQRQETAISSDSDSVDQGAGVAEAYCSIDSSGRRVKDRTLGEMEQEFLEAMSSWYFDGKAKLTNEEFELLREELLWNGSKIATLDSEEQKFLEASMAYARGQPILSDEEFDQLKQELRLKGSIVTAQGPRCSIRSKKMYSDATPDYLKMTLLNIPAALLVLGIVFSIDDITGFEITSLIELPPPYGIAALWGVLLPALFLLSTSLTNLVLKNATILKAPCPSCGTDNFTYFGDIFTVSGNSGQNTMECTNCKADLTFDLNKRVVVVDKTPEEKNKVLAAAAAKKAAAAAKKAAKKTPA